MNNPLVSISLGSWQGARTLEACLHSAKAQTYVPLETVVVERGSTDGSIEIAQRLADVYGFGGVERCAQRNLAVQLAKGEYVLLIDQDMRLSPGVVGACVAAMQANPSLVAVIIPEESFGEGFWAQCKKLERSFYVGVPWMEGARFCRRAAFLAVGGYDESLVSGEDWDLSQRLAARGPIGRVDAFIYHDEGRLGLAKTIRTKYFYATKFAPYARKQEHSAAVAKQTSVFARYALFLRQPRRLFANPFVGLGMLFMKTCEFGAGAAALLSARRRR